MAKIKEIRGKNLSVVFDELGMLIRVEEVPESGVWATSSVEHEIELVDGFIFPGFIDSHCHPHGGGLQLLGINLRDAGSLEECIRRLKVASSDDDRPEWILGAGWELHWFERGYPIAADLECVSGNRNPISLRDRDGHQAWVNSIVLGMIDFESDYARELDRKGLISRDDAGHPNGWLLEDAVHLVKKIMPTPSLEKRLKGLNLALEMANSFGITSVYDAAVTRQSLETFLEADRLGLLTCRVRGGLLYDTTISISDNLEWMKRGREACRGGRGIFECESVKLMIDGIIENHTAWMLHPYSLPPTAGRGRCFFDESVLEEVVAVVRGEGFQVHAHTIGDASTRKIIEISENLKSSARPGGESEYSERTVFAHLQVVQPPDLARLASLGAVLNFSPLWVQPDRPMTELAIPHLGPERAQMQYPIGSSLRAGCRISFGSDWPVTSMDPLAGIAVAVTHRAVGAPPEEEVFLPKELISVSEALTAYTQGSAVAMGIEPCVGSLQVGKQADFIVLDHNLRAVTEKEADLLLKTKVLRTYIGGKLVWSRI